MYPCYMSLSKSMFVTISQAFRIPPSYLYLRVNANASGAHTKYCQRNELGKITNMGRLSTRYFMDVKLTNVSLCNSCTPFPAE